MKKYIILFSLLAFCINTKSQVLIFANGDTKNFDSNIITQIIPEGNKISFVTASETYNYAIKDIKSLKFALDYETNIDKIGADEVAILYDSNTATVIVHNADEQHPINIYDSKGALVTSTKSARVCIKEYAPGVYIINHKKYNAKILKK